MAQILCYALYAVVACLPCTNALTSQVGPAPGQIKNLVTFGDSYTALKNVGDGGVPWPVYAAGYGPFDLFPFAVSGATCSNNLTNRPYPSIFESQLPLYFSEVENGALRLNPAETMYTLWIGTNDVGAGELLTGDQSKGVTVVDTVRCAVNWVSALYMKGARNFLFQNMIPLQNTILYARGSYPNRYWTFQRNTTEWNIFMTELTAAGNALARLMLQNLAPSLPDAHIGLFDSYSLFSDIIAHPSRYLNGTAPPNVTGAVSACIFQLNEATSDPGDCTNVNGSDRDSYLWADELHPSEQADRIVATTVTNAILRKSGEWTTWFS